MGPYFRLIDGMVCLIVSAFEIRSKLDEELADSDKISEFGEFHTTPECSKVGCVFPIVIDIYTVPCGIRKNDRRGDASHFNCQL